VFLEVRLQSVKFYFTESFNVFGSESVPARERERKRLALSFFGTFVILQIKFKFKSERV
jgi:hypothetical protein